MKPFCNTTSGAKH